MTWNSTTFQKPNRNTGDRVSKESVRVDQKHKSAMTEVVKRARELIEERRETLQKIKDPQLRRSASR